MRVNQHVHCTLSFLSLPTNLLPALQVPKTSLLYVTSRISGHLRDEQRSVCLKGMILQEEKELDEESVHNLR